jgi:hypothetical protein
MRCAAKTHGREPPRTREYRRRSSESPEQDRECLLQIVIQGTESAGVWLRARIVLLASQSMSHHEIAAVAGVNVETVRSVIDGFQPDGPAI